MAEEQGNMPDGQDAFPPVLRDELPADVSRPADLGLLYRRLFPWHLFPGTTTALVLVGPDGATHPIQPPPPEDDLQREVAEDDNYRLERRDISYLNYILASWQRRCISYASERQGTWAFPRPDDIANETTTTGKFYIYYMHAGVRWRSPYFTKCDTDGNKLIIHLANDGYLYMNTNSMGAIDKVQNDRHLYTTPIGWMVFKSQSTGHPDGKREEIYEALHDFRLFAESWFGTSDLMQSVLYNSQFHRIDICFKSKGNDSVGLEFSFERDWHYPGDDAAWWD